MEVKVKEESIDIAYNENVITETFVSVKAEDCGENVSSTKSLSTIKLECNYDLEPISKLLNDCTEFQAGDYLTNISSVLKQDTNLKTELRQDCIFSLPGSSKRFQQLNKKPSGRKGKYTCPICFNNFTSPISRKQHVDVHFGKCFNLCPICGAMCGKTSEFLTHYFIHRLKRKLTNRLNLIKPLPTKLPKNVLKHLNLQAKTSRCKKFYKKRNLKCRHCSDIFSCRVLFRKHKCFSKRAKHASKETIKCSICYKKCSTKFSLSNHLKIHKLNTIVCNICSKQFLRNNFYKHYRTHVGRELFSCDSCSKLFETKSQLETHLQCDKTEKTFISKTCSKPFLEQSQLTKHFSPHLPTKNYQCNVCFKEFPGKTHLETHMYDHMGVKPFMCEFCSKEFVRTDSLRNHLKMHMDDKKFQCDICQRRFVRRITLVEHYRTHTGEKPFKCDICPKTFTQKSQLRSHTRTHITEKPFVCEICSKPFVIQFQLKRHLLTHNAKKRFECEVCFKQFIEKRNLNAHMLLHTGTKPFKCELCSKGFTWRHNLNRHMKVHEKDAFQCDVCQEKFSRYHILQNHYRLHTGEVPYKCDICSKQFKQKITLTTHMLNHTTEDF